MPLKTSQEKLLGNSKNKAKFIHMFWEKLQTAKILTFQCEGDAERIIATTTISKAETLKRVIIVAEHTDILVLLMALTADNLDIYRVSTGNESNENNKKVPFFEKR